MNEDLFCGFLEETFDGNIVQYCNKMEKDGTWGGHLELKALSSVLRTNFRIYNERQDTVLVGIENSNNSTLNLAFDRKRFHYSGLVYIREEIIEVGQQKMTTKGTKKRKRDEISSEFEIANDLKKIKMNSNQKDSEKKKKFSSISIKIQRNKTKTLRAKPISKNSIFFK